MATNAMAHEVFISYRRTDLDLCTDVFQLIQRIGYVPYSDVTDLSGGDPWRDQLRKALAQPDLPPYVVVLCTKAAVAEPKHVVEEIQLAREYKLTIIPVEFDPGAARLLLEAAGCEQPGLIQHIDAIDPGARYLVNDRLEDALRRTLTRRVRRWLEERRAQAKEMAGAGRLNPTISFWETAWRDWFPLDVRRGLSGSVALTARGGSGKSILIAHCIHHLLDNPEIYPVVVEEALLRNAAGELPRLLGTRSVATLPEQVEALAAKPPGEHLGWKPMQIVFVVDGLDQMVAPGDARQERLVEVLNLLTNSAPVLIGCRQEVWDTWYAGRVSVRAEPVAELDEQRVRDLLLRHTALRPDRLNPLLQVPFFLDIALRKAGVWDQLPATETEFLQQIWSDGVAESLPDRQVLPGETGRAWLLDTLAAFQLARLAYDVPLADLRAHPGYQPDYQTGVRELKESGLLVERPPRVPGAGPTVRLRHDLLDNYSMVRVLLGAPDRLERCRELCRRCGKDCGWSVLATLVQAAHDSGEEGLKRELFAEFLFLLDHKKDGAEAMTRAWAVTHVLRSCFRPLFPLILDALVGDPTASLDPKDPAHVELRPSTLGPPALLTQESASTLASAFMVLHTGRVEDASAAVPVLARGLRLWTWKARFFDALGKYRTRAALDAIVDYAHQQLRERDDLDSLLYVAQNLRHFSSPKARAVLADLTADVTLAPRVRRVAAEGLNHLRPGSTLVPPRDEDEIVTGLAIREPKGVDYTDWHVVQEYADYVRGRVARGERFGPHVLEALTRALDHEQTFVRRPIAQALALFDEPAARDALLDEILEQNLPAEVRGACLEALGAQLRRVVAPSARQAFRYLLLRAARVVRHDGAILTAQALVELALNPDLRTPEDWLLTTGAVEVLPPAENPPAVRCSVAAQELDPAVMREMSEVGLEDVGPNREAKYRFADLKVAQGTVDVSLAPTTWHLGKNFHNAVQKHPGRFLRDGDRWLLPVPLGDTRLLGLAVVHAILLTADGQLLLAQRSAKAAYAPLHWSASFEEQVTEEDLRGGDRVFHLAAQRGLMEEFGVEVSSPGIRFLTAVLEMNNLNLAAVMLLEATQTMEQVRQSWSGKRRPSHAWEAEALKGIETSSAAFDALAGGIESPLEPLHPTSRARCTLLGRWLRSRERA